jgi:hypothetical protein
VGRARAAMLAAIASFSVYRDRPFRPRSTRTAVAFLDAERFAYSDCVGQRAEVRVLRIAER